MSADFAAASKTGGIVLIAYGLGQTLTLLNVPFFRNFAPLMMATESLPQSGSGQCYRTTRYHSRRRRLFLL